MSGQQQQKILTAHNPSSLSHCSPLLPILAVGFGLLLIVIIVIIVLGRQRIRYFRKMTTSGRSRDSTFDCTQITGRAYNLSYRVGPSVDDVIPRQSVTSNQFDLQTPTEHKSFALRVPPETLKVTTNEDLQRASSHSSRNDDVHADIKINDHMFDDISIG